MNKKRLLLAVIALILIGSVATVVYHMKNKSTQINEVTSVSPIESLTQTTIPASIDINVKILDKTQIVAFIEGVKIMIERMKKAEAELDIVTKNTKADMVKYPYNSGLQQAGKDLIDHNNKINLQSKKNIAFYNKLINIVTPYLQSNIPLKESELTPMINGEYQILVRDYSQLENGTGSLISVFEGTKADSQNN